MRWGWWASRWCGVERGAGADVAGADIRGVDPLAIHGGDGSALLVVV